MAWVERWVGGISQAAWLESPSCSRTCALPNYSSFLSSHILAGTHTGVPRPPCWRIHQHHGPESWLVHCAPCLSFLQKLTHTRVSGGCPAYSNRKASRSRAREGWNGVPSSEAGKTRQPHPEEALGATWVAVGITVAHGGQRASGPSENLPNSNVRYTSQKKLSGRCVQPAASSLHLEDSCFRTIQGRLLVDSKWSFQIEYRKALKFRQINNFLVDECLK